MFLHRWTELPIPPPEAGSTRLGSASTNRWLLSGFFAFGRGRELPWTASAAGHSARAECVFRRAPQGIISIAIDCGTHHCAEKHSYMRSFTSFAERRALG